MTPAQQDNPVVQQRRLRAELRRHREGAGLTQQAVAEALEWSTSKVVRIEGGTNGISKSDLTALLTYYGVTDDADVALLVELSRGSKRAAWWDTYKDRYSSKYRTFLGYESSARVIREFHALTIPDLLQTSEYAREVITACGTPPEQIASEVDVLDRRKQLLDRQDPPTLSFIIDEGVLRRRVGRAAVMRDQLNLLKKLNRRRNITIQIVRCDTTAYCGINGSFGVYKLPYDKDFVIVHELIKGDVLIQENLPETNPFMETFSNLQRVAAPSSHTGKIIDEILP